MGQYIFLILLGVESGEEAVGETGIIGQAFNDGRRRPTGEGGGRVEAMEV